MRATTAPSRSSSATSATASTTCGSRPPTRPSRSRCPGPRTASTWLSPPASCYSRPSAPDRAQRSAEPARLWRGLADNPSDREVLFAALLVRHHRHLVFALEGVGVEVDLVKALGIAHF